MIHLLINTRFPQEERKEEEKIQNKKRNKQSDLSQLENHIRILEQDIRHLLQREFQNKIKVDTLEGLEILIIVIYLAK